MIRRALCLAVTLGGVASAAPRPFTVEGIAFKLFDETTGKVVPIDKPPNPYGSNVSLLVIVKLKGPTETPDAPAPKPKLTLDVAAPASSDEATGDHPAWKLTQERELGPLPEKGIGYQLFLVPFQCREQVTFTATVGKATKAVKQSLACAE